MTNKPLVIASMFLGLALACGESQKASDFGAKDAVIDDGAGVPDTQGQDGIGDQGVAEGLSQEDKLGVDPGIPEEEVTLLQDCLCDFPPELPFEDVAVDSLPETWPADEGVFVPDIPPQDVPPQDQGGVGTGTCVDITDCITEQNCQTQACYQMCLAKGTPEAQQQFVALVQCGNQKCGQYGDDKPMQGAYCVYSQCREFAEPCAKTGTSTCMQVLQCAQPCGQNNEECLQACFEQASYDALLKILAIAACAEQNCPDMNETCMMTRCMQQIMACTSG
jgi:hypothetical protein